MILLTLIGIIAIWCVSPSSDTLFQSGPILSRANLAQAMSYQPIKQASFALLGLLLFILISRWNYYNFKGYAITLYVIAIVFLIALMFYGKLSNGSRRWFYMGPFAFQPSEYMKIITVLTLAHYLMHKTNIARLKGLFIPYLLVLVPMGLILIQPDLGTALVFLPMLFVMVYVAGARVKYLLITVLIGMLFIPVAYLWLMKDYQKARLNVFMNPSKSPTADAYHILQSRIAIGSGGFWGSFWHDADQAPTVFVPSRHNDFIFTVIAEKWGFVGVSVVLFLYFTMLAASLLIATTIREPYGRLIIVGIIAYLTTQIIINIAMTVGLAPITGITLPLVSYGGSSLTSTFIALGLIFNIRNKQIPTFSSRDFA
jgi:rod shape determining protein RodA